MNRYSKPHICIYDSARIIIGKEVNADLVFQRWGNYTRQWIVETNDQEYPGGIQIFTDATIVTRKDLVLSGRHIYFPNKNYHNHNGFKFFRENCTITKKGNGDLILSGGQYYPINSTIDVKEGMLVLKGGPFDGYFCCWLC